MVFTVGIYNYKKGSNAGMLWRTAHLYGADSMFTIGRPYEYESTDTSKAGKSIPICNYPTWEDYASRVDTKRYLVSVEMTDDALVLDDTYVHMKHAAYLLGSEATGLPNKVLEASHHVLRVPTVNNFSMNVAVAGSIVMFDRFSKAGQLINA